MLASLEMLDMVKMYTVTLMMGTNDVSRGGGEFENGNQAARENVLYS